MGEGRTLYFDRLRVLATLAVVMLHVSIKWFSTLEISSTQWKISVIYNSATRWAVPMFVMISGALFLNRDISVKKLYTKYIFRMVTAFVFWSLLYAVITDPGANIKGMIVNTLYGHYHMWFLYMIVGLYITVPVLRKIAESESVTKYFLALAFVVTFLFPQIIRTAECLPGSFQLLGDMMNTVIEKLKIGMFGGFVSYFVAGYYLSKKDISIKWRKMIYFLGGIGFVATIIFTILLCSYQGIPNEMFFESFTVNIALFSIAVLVFGKYEVAKIRLTEKGSSFIARLSKYSFGSYLVHALVLSIVWQVLPVDASGINALIGIPLISVLVFVISMGLSAIFNQIPIVKKFVV